MAEYCDMNKKVNDGLSINFLKSKIQLTDSQLDTRVEEADLPELAACFDNTEDYVEKLGLSTGQQTDVRTQGFVNGTQTGIKIALKYWRIKNLEEATFRALLLILLSLFKGHVAIQVGRYLSSKDTIDFSHFKMSGSQTSHLLWYKHYLQSRYKGQLFSSSLQWPPIPTTKVFKLAMIQREKIQRGRIDDEFVRLSITGKVDDILQHKTPVEIKNLFYDDHNEKKFVLIEGAPGSGKSTLALHICQEWAEGKLFQEYDIVILVRLRDPLIREAKTIADLLPCTDKKMAVKIETLLTELLGKGMLWVMDGWDELPPDLPFDSIINKIVEPGRYQENPLLQSTLIVTSRPSLSAKLHSLISSRVEVLGFTPDELEQYFRECLKGDIGAVKTLLERIRENPVVEGSCYLPLNAAIVAHVFLCGECTLPTSNHEIFMSVIQNSLKRYLCERLGKSTTAVGNILCSESLALEIKTPFIDLCQLAFYGIENNKLTFTKKDFLSLSISEDTCQAGLIQSTVSIIIDGRLIYYSFLHLSIQELLAAIHISHMSPKQQILVFQKLFGTPRFSAVFQFYAGITKFKSSRPFFKLFPRFLFPPLTSIRSFLKVVIKKELKKPKREPKSLLVSLLHCLYEAEDSSLCVFVADLLDNQLNLRYTTLSPLDCLSIGYFISVVGTNFTSDFTVNLNYCSIADRGCKFLVKGVHRHLATQSKIVSPLDMYLWYNDIHEDGIYQISKLFKIEGLIHMISFTGDKLSNTSLKCVCDALQVNSTLKTLSFFHCLPTITDENGSYFHKLLSNNACIDYLVISSSKIESCHPIAAGLSNNKSLKTLILSYCSLTDQSMKDLSAGLNDYIKKLDIHGNDDITMTGMKILAERVRPLSGLKYLILPLHLESSISSVFSNVSEDRRANGLSNIEVAVSSW